MDEQRLRIRLYGPFAMSWANGEEIDLRSAKLKALVALLGTAPDGGRTRSWLQDMLWSLSGPEHGRASLRQAMSRLRRALGPGFETIFQTNNDTIRLRREYVVVVGEPADGELLEGVDIPDEGFNAWLRQQRASPGAPLARSSLSLARAPAAARLVNANGAPLANVERVTPAVAVIPFAGMDADGTGSQLGDAMAQDITRSLSRSPLLHVISHLSCRNAAVRQGDLAVMRTLLGADVYVSGQMRVMGERFRLDVDFVDGGTGELKWTRTYNGALAHFLSGTDEVVDAVAGEVISTVLSTSLAPLAYKPLPDLSSHTLLMAAVALMNKQSLGHFAKSRSLIEEVIRRAPQHATLHAWLAKWYVLSINQGWSTDVTRDTAIAAQSVGEALAIDPANSFSLSVKGLVTHYRSDMEDAFDVYEDALAIEPNNALAWLLKGTLHGFVDEGPKAVECVDRARSLAPVGPQSYYFDSLSATAYLANCDFENALHLAERSLEKNRRHTSTLRVRAIALQRLGRRQEAREAAAQLLAREPGFSVSHYRDTHPAARYRTGRDWADALSDAGLAVG